MLFPIFQPNPQSEGNDINRQPVNYDGYGVPDSYPKQIRAYFEAARGHGIDSPPPGNQYHQYTDNQGPYTDLLYRMRNFPYAQYKGCQYECQDDIIYNPGLGDEL